MSRFYFVHEDTDPYSRVAVETDAVTLPDVLKQVENFLRGVGYYIDGRLEVVGWDPVEGLPEVSQDFLDHFERQNNENSV
jgi:hypothetical protein